MPHPSKAKGNTAEREIVHLAKARGYDAVRAYASNGTSLGYTDDVDLVIHHPAAILPIQSKRRKALPQYLKPTLTAPIVATREDRGEWLVVMPLNLLLDILDETHEGSTDTPIRVLTPRPR
jgi:Holliday junction resolvase